MLPPMLHGHDNWNRHDTWTRDKFFKIRMTRHDFMIEVSVLHRLLHHRHLHLRPDIIDLVSAFAWSPPHLPGLRLRLLPLSSSSFSSSITPYPPSSPKASFLNQIEWIKSPSWLIFWEKQNPTDSFQRKRPDLCDSVRNRRTLDSQFGGFCSYFNFKLLLHI